MSEGMNRLLERKELALRYAMMATPPSAQTGEVNMLKLLERADQILRWLQPG